MKKKKDKLIEIAKTVGVDDIKGTKKDIVNNILKAKAEENVTSQTLKGSVAAVVRATTLKTRVI